MAVTRLGRVSVTVGGTNAVAVTQAIAMTTMARVTDVTGVTAATVVAVGPESHHPHDGEPDAAEEEE
jgi:hypothetical protein